MNNSPVNSIINSTTVGDLAEKMNKKRNRFLLAMHFFKKCLSRLQPLHICRFTYITMTLS